MNPGRRLSRVPRFYIDITLLIFAEFTWAIGVYMYYGLLPVHIKQYVSDEKVISLILSVTYITGTLAFVGGFLSRRFNLKWLTVLCWAVTIPAPLFYAFAESATGFFIGQIFYSLTTVFSPAVILYIFDSRFEGDKMGPYLIYSLSATVPVIIAPAIGGAVASVWGMRSVFLIAAGLLALGSFFTLLITPLAPQKTQREIPCEPDAPVPATPPPGRGRLWLYLWLLLMLSASFSHSIAEPMLSLYMQQQNAMSLEQIGLAYTLSGIGGFLLTLAVRKFGPRFRPIAVLGILSLLVSASNVIMQAGSMILILAAMPLRGAGRASLFYAQGTVSSTLDGPDKSMLVAGYIAVRSLAYMLATNLGGILYTTVPTLPFWTEIGVMAVWGIAFALYERRDSRLRRLKKTA